MSEIQRKEIETLDQFHDHLENLIKSRYSFLNDLKEKVLPRVRSNLKKVASLKEKELKYQKPISEAVDNLIKDVKDEVKDELGYDIYTYKVTELIKKQEYRDSDTHDDDYDIYTYKVTEEDDEKLSEEDEDIIEVISESPYYEKLQKAKTEHEKVKNKYYDTRLKTSAKIEEEVAGKLKPHTATFLYFHPHDDQEFKRYIPPTDNQLISFLPTLDYDTIELFRLSFKECESLFRVEEVNELYPTLNSYIDGHEYSKINGKTGVVTHKFYHYSILGSTYLCELSEKSKRRLGTQLIKRSIL